MTSDANEPEDRTARDAAQRRSNPPTYTVYVIRLQQRAEHERALQRENPDYVPGKPVVYVGSTAKTPEERFRQHLTGRRHWNRFVRRYGHRLFYWAMRDVPTFATRAEAEAAEAALAQRLRARSWMVWQN